MQLLQTITFIKQEILTRTRGRLAQRNSCSQPSREMAERNSLFVTFPPMQNVIALIFEKLDWTVPFSPSKQEDKYCFLASGTFEIGVVECIFEGIGKKEIEILGKRYLLEESKYGGGKVVYLFNNYE